jgi:hypothetical protein
MLHENSRIYFLIGYSLSIPFFIEIDMPWQEGDQSHACILSSSIVSPLSRIYLLYFGIILMLYFFSSVYYRYGSTVNEK